MNWLIVLAWPIAIAATSASVAPSRTLTLYTGLYAAWGWPFWTSSILAWRVAPKLQARLITAADKQLVQRSTQLADLLVVPIEHALALPTVDWRAFVAERQGQIEDYLATMQAADDLVLEIARAESIPTEFKSGLARIKQWIDKGQSLGQDTEWLIAILAEIEPRMREILASASSANVQTYLESQLRERLSSHPTVSQTVKLSRTLYKIWLGLSTAGWAVPGIGYIIVLL